MVIDKTYEEGNVDLEMVKEICSAAIIITLVIVLYK